MKPPYKLEKQPVMRGWAGQDPASPAAEQWVVIPAAVHEFPRTATACEVSLWKAWETQRKINERILAQNRIRFAERLEHGRRAKHGHSL